jgi:hypothetical protein
VVDFYEEVIKPLDPQMSTKKVIDELLKLYTKTNGGSFINSVVSCSIFAEQPNTIFISHSNDNAFSLLVESLTKHFSDATKWSETFLLIDLFAIDQNKTTDELQDQLRKISKSVLVVVNDKAYPAEELMTRMDQVRTY